MKTPIENLIEAFFGKQKLIIPFVMMIIGMFLYMFSRHGMAFYEIVRENLASYIGLSLIVLAMLWVYLGAFYRIWKRKREDSFSEVDARRREMEGRVESEVILDELRSLKESQTDIDYEKLRSIFQETKTKEEESRKKIFDSFENYFGTLSTLLEKQARTADEKASILLDKGTSYSRNGIFFFVFCIVAWQVLAAYQGFQDQHLYGIASCSLLFVFIEFLSAWFLKQYRHYVDTSTYLLKVKSIFDRYMLSYLALKSPDISADSDKCSHLIDILSEDIKWPESYLLKNGDVSFAKEAMETMTHFAKAMKSEAKSATKKQPVSQP
ncbi:hypothetical protein [Pseudoalteromonas xiamenensis]